MGQAKTGTVILAGEFGRKMTSQEADEYVPVGVQKIRRLTADQINNWIEIGQVLARLKDTAGHGRFKSLFPASKEEYADPEKLPFSQRTGNMLMAIANHDAITNSQHAAILPTDYTSLYELSRLDPPVLQTAIEAGEITPTTSRTDIKKLVSLKKMAKPKQEPKEEALSPFDKKYEALRIELMKMRVKRRDRELLALIHDCGRSIDQVKEANNG